MINIQKKPWQILAVDVGAGTQDILLFDSNKEPGNNLKLVIPSNTQILARKISKIDTDIFLTGGIMGGGPVSMAISNHLKKGFTVSMTESSARTVRDDLDEVREDGVEIVDEADFTAEGVTTLETRDVDLDFIFQTISMADEPMPDFIGVAVQDHGFEKNKSDRVFRFEMIKKTLERGASLEDFLFNEPPEYYTRMNSVFEGVKEDFDGEVVVIDSKFAAIAGALHNVDERPCICVDVGNGHTMIALIDEGGIAGVLEHHTGCLTKNKLVDYIEKLANGKVSNSDVFNDDGHGCYIKEAPGLKSIKRVLATGPNRKMLLNTKLDIDFANPFGDVMMTGPVGIVDLIKKKYG